MHIALFAAFFGISRTVVAMCGAGILVSLIAVWFAKSDLAQAGGLDRIVALVNLCFAVPLAVFGALHVFGVEIVLPLVPRYMPWRLFWAYFVGFALLAASLSIATKIQVRWSGLLFGIMMFLFVAMMEFRGALARPGNRFGWELVAREMSFAGGGWLLAATAMLWQGRRKLITVGRVLIALTTIFFGVENFLHPAGVPVVPLVKTTPVWIPGRLLIGYVTGILMGVAGLSMLLDKKTGMAATYLGAWIALLILFVYGPILFVSLSNPSTGVKIEGINYFADTMLFAGAILALASATPRAD